jgi:gas vesicle protein
VNHTPCRVISAIHAAAFSAARLNSYNVAESSKGGFWRRVLQIPDDDTDRARERTRARIAYALIGALVVAIAATFLYVVTLSAGNLSPEEIINVTHGLGTTLLAPLVGLIGAVIGFYYGGQTAVQGAQQATVASQKHAEATQEATQAATQTAKEATQAATQTAKEATQAATQTAKEATQAATQVATQATQTANEATQVAKEATQARQ